MVFTRRTFMLGASSLLGAFSSLGVVKDSLFTSNTLQKEALSSASSKLKRAIFASLLNRTMTVRTANGEFTQFKLTAVTSISSDAHFDQFTLQFSGTTSVGFPQGLYEVDFPEIGTIPLLLIPTTANTDRVINYRADFAIAT